MSSREAPPGREFRLQRHIESMLFAAVVVAVAVPEDLLRGESKRAGERRLVGEERHRLPLVPKLKPRLLRLRRLKKVLEKMD